MRGKFTRDRRAVERHNCQWKKRVESSVDSLLMKKEARTLEAWRRPIFEVETSVEGGLAEVLFKFFSGSSF
jgi:hypothetical protein